MTWDFLHILQTSAMPGHCVISYGLKLMLHILSVTFDKDPAYKKKIELEQSDSDKGLRIMPCIEKVTFVLATILIIIYHSTPIFRHEQ